jgi:hypothetical protein
MEYERYLDSAHGSLEAISGRTKLSTKTKTGDGEGWSQVPQTSFIEIRSASSPHKVFESLFFSASVNFYAFFDTYFVVISHLRL